MLSWHTDHAETTTPPANGTAPATLHNSTPAAAKRMALRMYITPLVVLHTTWVVPLMGSMMWTTG